MKIVVIKDNKPIEQISFSGREATIGRKSDCDISIKDPAVSGLHAKVLRNKDKFVIQDQGSTNGIFVRGRRVKQYTIQHDDVVTIGEHHLKFVITETATSGSEPPPAPVAAPRVDPRVAVGGFLTVASGPKTGDVIKLDEGLTTIGQPGVQVAAISRRPQGHFVIHVDGGKDRERVPLVNGEPIGFKSRKLEDGDRIEVAGIAMTYAVS